MGNGLVRLFGWKATVLHADPCFYDRWKWIEHRLLPGRRRTLDAGCGSGALTFYAAAIGNEAVGLSFDATKNAVARARAELLGYSLARFVDADLRSLEEVRPDLGTFDQIVCFETIEHIREDRRVARDLAHLLRPGGSLFLTTPSSAHRPAWDKVSELEDGGHVRWGYTHRELRALIEASGLNVVEEHFVSGVVSQKLTSLMFSLSRISTLLGWFVVLPLRPLRALDVPLTRLLGFPYLSVAVVAERPAVTDPS